MRAKDFLIVEAQQELFEVNMSPSNLKKLASQIDARVGIEFEMIVPDVGSLDDGYNDPEPDYDMDERVDDIDDIIRFFNDGEYNDRSSLRELEETLRGDYYEWLEKRIEEFWEDEKLERVYQYIAENVPEEVLADELNVETDLFGNRQITKDMIREFALKQIDDEGEYYSDAKDEFTDEVRDDPEAYDFSDSVWVDEAGLRRMSDVEDSYSISWPHWNYPDSGGDADLESLAEEFSDAIGRKVNWSTDYHGGNREDDAYDIEPDSSLSGSGSDDAGLEFISPPLPLDQMLDDIKKVKEWADERGCYTNRSTGLHMNVSVPGFDPEKLDFVKLTLLLGDKYILDRFGRSANTYCKSAMEIIEEAPNPQDKELLFKKLKDNLDTIASRVIHSGRVGKFTSINPKNNRVEFRGPGGDWLNQNFDKIDDTLLRCVVALDAAVDPDKYRKDYLKKLTKMFAPSKGSIEDIFVQYAAGTITRTELKHKLKQVQSKRKQDKYTAQGIVEVPTWEIAHGDWIIESENERGDIYRLVLKRTEQVSTDKQALEAAMKVEPSWFKPTEIENITVTQFAGKENYVVTDSPQHGGVVIFAISPLQAIQVAMDRYPDLVSRRAELTATLKTNEPEPTSAPRMAPGEQMFVVINNTTGQQVEIAAIDSATALSRALRNNPSWDSYNHQIRVLSTTPQSEQEYKLYRVRGNGNSEYVSARSVSEAGRIALTAFPNLGDRVDDLDIVLQDADPNVVNMYLRAQQDAIDSRNSIPTRQTNVQATMGQPQPAFGGEDNSFGNWYVSDRRSGETIIVPANNERHAFDRAMSHRPNWNVEDLSARRQRQS